MSTNPGTLRANSIGIWGLLFLGMGLAAPISVLLAISGVPYSLGATAFGFFLGMIGALLSANTILQYSKRMADARGYYGYITDGLGRYLGAFTAYLYVFYMIFNVSFLAFLYIAIFSAGITMVFGVSLPMAVGIIFVAGSLAIAAWVSYRGIQISAVLLGGFVLAEIALVIVVGALFIAKAPAINLAPLTPLNPPGWHGILLGVITGTYIAFAGFGSIVPLGEEARAARRTIGQAVIGIILIAGILGVFGAYAMTELWGVNHMSSFAAALFPSIVLAKRYVSPVLGGIILVMALLAIGPPLVSILNALSRNIYAMGRDGLLPRKLATVSRHGTPGFSLGVTLAVALVLQLVLGVTLSVRYGFSTGMFDAFVLCGLATTLATLLIHILANIALMTRSGGDARNAVTHLLIPVVATVITAAAIYYGLATTVLTMPVLLGPILLAVYVVVVLVGLGAGWSKVPDLRSKLGSSTTRHGEATADR
ncbi:MAG: APC family permease [Candidatus Dormibacteria bacterium]